MTEASRTGSTKPLGKYAHLGRVGIWSMELRFGDPGQAADAASELDELGFGTLWTPGGIGGDVLGDIGRLLSATRKATIATGIINIWKHEPHEIGAWWSTLPADRKERVLLGLGVSHGPLIGDAYRKPLAAMDAYLTKLAAEGLPAAKLCVAALAPKMLELARNRTAGSHPYLVTPEHTAMARKLLGPDALLAPEQGVVLDTDPERARELCRQALTHYRRLPNYMNNWRRMGFTEDDIASLSNHLIDGIFAWGGTDKIAERVKAHHAAGADHVCLQVISSTASPDFGALRAAWRTLATALL